MGRDGGGGRGGAGQESRCVLTTRDPSPSPARPPGKCGDLPRCGKKHGGQDDDDGPNPVKRPGDPLYAPRFFPGAVSVQADSWRIVGLSQMPAGGEYPDFGKKKHDDEVAAAGEAQLP